MAIRNRVRYEQNDCFVLFCFVAHNEGFSNTNFCISRTHTKETVADMNDWKQYVCQHDGMV